MPSYPLVRDAIVNIQRNAYELLSGKGILVDEKQRVYINNLDRCATILLAEFDGYSAELAMATTETDITRYQHALKLDRTPLAIIATSCYLVQRIPTQVPLTDQQIQYVETIEKNQFMIVNELERWASEMGES